MKIVTDWLDARTGYRGIMHAMLFEHIPGGARWRYVWGSTLVFCFGVQMVTGLFLWMSYSPSSQTAWESVYYIQHHMLGGWLLRGIHHFTAQIMVVLIALHMLQVIIDGAYRAPREVNFWIGLVLLQIVLGLSLTGYLLPWDQKGYWATKVATNIMAIVPVVGPQLQQIVVGGPDYGHHTLTRFFALHAGLLPFLMILFTAGHIYVFRRHGIHAKTPDRQKDSFFWVDQVMKDAIACLGVLLVVIILVLYQRYSPWGNHVGAELTAPADPSSEYSAARPEWYFLFLFQFLKFFPGKTEVWGAVFIPGMVMAILFLMPLIGRWNLGHRFNVSLIIAILISAGVLTGWAMLDDWRKSDYKLALAQAHVDSNRIIDLANHHGIPAEGAVTLLRSDPKTQGPKLFAQHCASCHRYGGHNALGLVDAKNPPSAPDLANFATRAWLTGLLDPAKVASPHYFGNTKFKDGEMVDFVKTKVTEYDDAKKDTLNKIIVAVSAEAGLKSQRTIDARDAALIEEGRKLITARANNCIRCHRFGETGSETGPNLTAYGSREYITAFLHNPAHERFYGEENDRMPAFGAKQMLTPQQISLLVEWLRGEWYEPGDPPPSPSSQPTTRPQ